MTTIMGITSKYIITRCVSQLYNVTVMTNKDIALTHVMTSRDIISWLMSTETSPDPLRTKNKKLIVVTSNYHKLSKVLSCLWIAEKAAVLLWLLSRRWIYDWVKETDPGRGQEEPFIMSFSWVTYFICEFCSIDPLCVAMSPTKM